MVLLRGSTSAGGMDEAWFTGFSDELAQCLLDAERCAAACESLLRQAQRGDDSELQKILIDALVAPAAVARVLIELIEQPPNLVLAACRLCRDVADQAAEQLATLGDRLDVADAIAALRASAGSCGNLLDVV
jgi:hypothetical protein